MLAWLALSASIGSAAVFTPALAPGIRKTIYKGEPAAASDDLWRSVVQVDSRDSDCSGTLVAPNVVLTAAHCVKDDKSKRAQLPLRVLFFGPDGSRLAERRVLDARFPSGYDRKGASEETLDMALVLFAGRAPATHRTVPLASFDSDVRPGAELLVAGYGLTGARKAQGLRKATLRLAGSEGYLLTLKRDDHAGICDGDSGGPAFVWSDGRRRLAGVASATVERSLCRTVYFSEFISVPRASWWLEPNLLAFEAAALGAMPAPDSGTYDVLFESGRSTASSSRRVKPLALPPILRFD